MRNHMTTWLRASVATVGSVCLAGALAPASLASAPKLELHLSPPTYVSAGESIPMQLAVQNVGDEATRGPIVVTDTAGEGMGPGDYRKFDISSYANVPAAEPSCETSGTVLRCEYNGVLNPGVQLLLDIDMPIASEATGALTNTVSASSVGAGEDATDTQHITVGPPGPFGFTLAAARLLNADGSEAVAAGSDPAEFTTTLRWASHISPFLSTRSVQVDDGHFKNVVAHLPAGLIGNPAATPALCTPDELAEKPEKGEGVNISNCPIDSQVGLAHVYIFTAFPQSDYVALYNMVPPYGAATELGFNIYGTNVLLKAYVRPGDHGIDIVSEYTSTSAPISGVDITAWGNPSDPSHDPYRGLCLDSIYEGPNGKRCPSLAAPKAFLRLPTSCSGKPLQFGAESNSYEEPENWSRKSFTGPTLTNCDIEPFAPKITVDPTGTAANSPTGVTVKVSLPQSQDPEGLATADLKKAVVTLPEGMALNPSSADGLTACDDAHLHLDSTQPAECPDGSKVGTVTLHTQLIAHPIEGTIYVRPQNSSEPESGEMFRIAFELRDDERGLDFKIPGQIAANATTGRLTSTFDEDPQLPFEDIELHFKAGARAPLVTPASCETQTTEASLYSWAQPEVPVHRSSSFTLGSGPNGAPCASPWPFAPGLNAGTSNVEAGNFTSFLTTFSRSDVDQSMKRVSVKMPKGLLGSLASVALCAEPQASQGTCGADSQIGTMTAGAGAGPTPFYVTGGKVFITGPYEDAPFGLSVVIPAKAGPFDLGTVVVRAKVELDPYTAQLTVTTDPLPQVVGGVPVNLRLVNVTINRPNFVFNPTDCDYTSVTGSMEGGEGAVAELSKGFQVTNCGSLGFKPKFNVSTSAKTSRTEGASLNARLSYPSAPLGSQSNIAKVRVELPGQLPSRLTTLQKACTDHVFEADPAQCPSASRVGFAVASTPVLPVPLEGPAYFVSHGGARFPELDIVLQGYGVTEILRGETFISKAGVTSTTFNTVPDVPIGNFDLKLPAGPDSALAANGDLCAQKLVMPTTFTAQDGKVIEEATPVKVEGCAPEIRVVRHAVHGKTATVVVRVPSPGKLVASGGGVLRATRTIAKAGTVTLRLRLSKSEQHFVAHHHGRRLRVPIRLSFTPAHGGTLRASVAVLMR